MIPVRPEIVEACRNFERQLEILEPGFLTRQAQLEGLPAEAESAEACAAGGICLGLHLLIDAADMEAALGSWDEGTPCILNAQFSAGSKKRSLKAITSSGQGLGYDNFLNRLGKTLQEAVGPFLVQGCLALKVCVTADARPGA